MRVIKLNEPSLVNRFLRNSLINSGIPLRNRPINQEKIQRFLFRKKSRATPPLTLNLDVQAVLLYDQKLFCTHRVNCWKTELKLSFFSCLRLYIEFLVPLYFFFTLTMLGSLGFSLSLIISSLCPSRWTSASILRTIFRDHQHNIENRFQESFLRGVSCYLADCVRDVSLWQQIEGCVCV